jgi:pyruvate formate lyase activating enzyme
LRGRIFEIREFTLHDGPGVRTTVFFKGCPLRCAWCHNPEGQSFEIETMVRKGGEEVVCGGDWTAAALAEELLRNADIMSQSGGGVTFSGGEPLAQAQFLLELIPMLKEKGVHLAIETSGHVSHEAYAAVVSKMDFVYQDVKLLDAAAFRRWTDGDLALVEGNIAWLRTSGVPFVFRVPCIPGVNDSAADRVAFESFADGAKVEFLPYNTAAGAKYPMLGRVYPI